MDNPPDFILLFRLISRMGCLPEMDNSSQRGPIFTLEQIHNASGRLVYQSISVVKMANVILIYKNLSKKV